MGNEKYNPNQGNNPYRINREPTGDSNSNRYASSSIDFDEQRICPACGKVIKINHNFCKFCGVDLSAIQPLGYSDRTLKQLAITALTDPDPGVRKDAVDTLGDLGEAEVLGVFAYILLNDSDESVRKEAADELGDMHHPHSLDILARALKDKSPIVRKEAIEGLKKIKKKNKPEKIEPEYRKEEEEPPQPQIAEPRTIEFSGEEEEEEEEFEVEEDVETEGETLEEVEDNDDTEYQI
ncbi:MAG: HEAT repeat domain-containing protein [Candidatus Hermodarchaeota archaeon]